MVKEKKQKVLVKVQSAYYKTNKTFYNLSEESLLELDPLARTKACVTLEKNDDFDSTIDNMLKIDDCILSNYEKECGVLYTTMWFDDEVVYKSIQKVGMGL
ncbi:MAG: hypothetical protein HFG91_06550 [Acholeplasmatales bacterium]|nr:hypothetical protein [Acholeplasmatales bacterium]